MASTNDDPSSRAGRGPDGGRHLSAAQAGELQRLASDPRTPPRVAARARWALSEAASRAGAVAPGDAPSHDRRLAGRWLERYAELGREGLHDRPRSGRPVGGAGTADTGIRWDTTDSATRRVVLAPLFAPDPAWSSRSVATELGTSQSSVARVWGRVHAGRPGEPALLAPDTDRLLAVALSPGNSLIVLGPGSGLPPAGGRSLMRSVRRRPFQTMLAADLLRDRGAGTGTAQEREVAGSREQDRQHGLERDATLVLQARSDAAGRVVALTRVALPVPDDDPGCRQVVVPDPARWQALLPKLVAQVSRPSNDALVTVQRQLMQWARGGPERFEWSDGRGLRRPQPLPVDAPRPTTAVVADDLFGWLVDRIVRGRLHGGERITESEAARALRTTRSRVRDALRALGANGLVDLEPHRGAFVPTPVAGEVIETYAVRRGLGALLVRRAAQLGPDVLEPVDRALARMLDLARTTNDSYLTGDADLDLQDVLAGVTGMRRTAPMFRTTTAQLRLYIAVLGLNYIYPIEDMCQDDVRLVQHLHDRDEQAAVAAWNAKTDAALRIMTSRVRHVRPGPRRHDGGR